MSNKHEPVAWLYKVGNDRTLHWNKPPLHGTPLYITLPQHEQAEYGYASRLAIAIWEKHYKTIAPNWKPLDDLMGVLTQIDNMTSGLTREQIK